MEPSKPSEPPREDLEPVRPPQRTLTPLSPRGPDRVRSGMMQGQESESSDSEQTKQTKDKKAQKVRSVYTRQESLANVPLQAAMLAHLDNRMKDTAKQREEVAASPGRQARQLQSRRVRAAMDYDPPTESDSDKEKKPKACFLDTSFARG